MRGGRGQNDGQELARLGGSASEAIVDQSLLVLGRAVGKPEKY